MAWLLLIPPALIGLMVIVCETSIARIARIMTRNGWTITAAERQRLRRAFWTGCANFTTTPPRSVRRMGDSNSRRL